MKISLNVLKITIVAGNGTDQIFLKTDNPEGVFPFKDKELTLKFEVAKGKGLSYLKDVFNIESDSVEYIKYS